MPIHFAKLTRSDRLKRMYRALGKDWTTTRELQEATGSMAVHTDIAELRPQLRLKGKDIECKMIGVNGHGRRVFGYRLVKIA